MSLLIDGHNLIGAGVFQDIHLGDEDDEAKLVARLKVWRSRVKGKITVVFDRGIPGGRDMKMGGSGVEVIFAADPTQADDLIRRRLHKRPKGLTLVTNDDALIQEATRYGIATERGDAFVQRMAVQAPAVPEPGTEEDVRLSKSEVDEWLALFGERETKQRRRKRREAGDPAGGRGSPDSKPGPKSKSKRKPPRRSKS